VQRFRDGLVFKAHRLLYHSTLGVRVIKKKKEAPRERSVWTARALTEKPDFIELVEAKTT